MRIEYITFKTTTKHGKILLNKIPFCAYVIVSERQIPIPSFPLSYATVSLGWYIILYFKNSRLRIIIFQEYYYNTVIDNFPSFLNQI